MASSDPKVLVAGPFPGPRHGMAIVTEAIADVVDGSLRLDLSAGGVGGSRSDLAKKVRNVAKSLATLALRGRSFDHLVLAVDSGEGMLITFLMVILGRFHKLRITLQHHTWAYLRDHRGLMDRIISTGGPELEHMFLCERAAGEFREMYRPPGPVLVAGNAFSVPLAQTAVTNRDHLVVGHLANLSRAKGIEEVVVSVKQNPEVSFLIAGPAVDDVARSSLEQLAALPNVELRGQLDDVEVRRFHSDTDIFLLPSETEAMPLVVWEAMSSGSSVVGYDVGCVGSMANSTAIRVAHSSEEFQSQLRAAISQRVSGGAEGKVCRQTFEEIRRRHTEELIALMQGNHLT